MQRRLLQEKEDKLSKAMALDTVTAAECASQQQDAMRGEDAVKSIRGRRREEHRKDDDSSSDEDCKCCGIRHSGQCKYNDSSVTWRKGGARRKALK